MSDHPVITAPPQQPPAPPLATRIASSARHSARALGLVWESAPGGVVALAAFTMVAAALPRYVALLIRFSGWMALAVLIATVPAFIAEARFSGAAFRLRNWRSPDSRRLTYLEYVLGNDEHAKEVKLFGLAPLLLGRYRHLAESFFADDRRMAIGRAGWGYLLSLLSTAVSY